MSFAPGLVGETVAAGTFRAFLGAPPHLAVEKRLLRHMHVTVGPWFQTRRRVREGASEYLEFDGSAPDTEIMLRHCHIFFLRRQLFNDVLEKQISILEAGKPPREPDPEIFSCLAEMNDNVSSRYLYENKRLEFVKANECGVFNIPHRRELAPNQPLDKWDISCMVRCLESSPSSFLSSPSTFPLSQDELSELVLQQQQQGGSNSNSSLTNDSDALAAATAELIHTAESRAKAFLPFSAVSSSACKLAHAFSQIHAGSGGGGGKMFELDKKDEKFGMKTFVPGDYTKTGLNPNSTPRLRPMDATSFFKFVGERAFVSDQKVKDGSYFFRRSLWGHVFRKFATNPAFLSNSISQYWGSVLPPKSSSNPSSSSSFALHDDAPNLKLPLALSHIVCHQQTAICPAIRLRTQFMYCHHDHAKQLWNTDLVLPSLRLLSATGMQCSEDLLSSVLVDGFFNELEGSSNDSSSASKSSSNSKEGSDSKNNSKSNKKEQRRGGERGDQQQRLKRATSNDLISDEKMRKIVNFVNEVSNARTNSVDALLQRALHSLKSSVAPPLSEEEEHWNPTSPASSSSEEETIVVEGDEDDNENNSENKNEDIDDDDDNKKEQQEEGEESEERSEKQ